MEYDPTSDPDQEPKKRRLSPKTHFRAIVRLVIENIPWLSDSDGKFGTRLYAMKKTMKSNLALEHKAILNKDPEYRSFEENEAIYKMIGGFKCFRKYPEHVKMMLASYSHFCYFGSNRVIVRENHYATAIFFIISGEVNVIEEKHDVYLDETERIVTETLTAGDVFGEICLLHNLPRMETIVSATPVEFLILKRDDFDLVLKGTVKEEWDFISSLMESFEYFDDWDKVRIGECCMQSAIKRYKKHDNILGDGCGRKNYVHFVIEGSCSLVEQLRVKERKLPSGKSLFALYDPEKNKGSFTEAFPVRRASTLTQFSKDSQQFKDTKRKSAAQSYHEVVDTKRKSIRRDISSMQDEDSINSFFISQIVMPPDVINVFMQVCTFSRKACFSLGEPMTNRRIVADEPCLCLLIPGYLLLGRDAIWLRIKQFLTKRIPTTQVVFDHFIREQEWRRYKTDLVTPLLNSYCTNWYANIPYTTRIHNDFEFKPNLKETYSLTARHVKATK